MELQSNFTTPEQTKRLLELGVPANSADCYYNDIFCKSDWQNAPIYIRQSVSEIDSHFFENAHAGHVYPCWSVGKLMEILKTCITDINELYEIFEYLRDTYDSAECLVQVYKEWLPLLNFSKFTE